MNVMLRCKLSLSKKIRKVVEEGATLTLVSSEIVGGNGMANLSLYVKDDVDVSGLVDMGETSLIITPMSVGDNMPQNVDSSVASIFTST